LKFLLTKRPYLFANNNDDKSAIDVAINGEILAVSINIHSKLVKMTFFFYIGISRIYLTIKRLHEETSIS